MSEGDIKWKMNELIDQVNKQGEVLTYVRDQLTQTNLVVDDLLYWVHALRGQAGLIPDAHPAEVTWHEVEPTNESAKPVYPDNRSEGDDGSD